MDDMYVLVVVTNMILVQFYAFAKATQLAAVNVKDKDIGLRNMKKRSKYTDSSNRQSTITWAGNNNDD